jgi:hypothetical protein
MVFNKGGLLQKRNGYAQLTALPSTASVSTLTTHGDTLTAIGNNVYSFSEASGRWTNTGSFQPLSLSVLPLARTAGSLSSADTAVSPAGLICSTFLDSDGSYKYQIADSNGQVIVGVTALPSTANVPRVAVLGNYFVIVFLVTVTATPHVQYIAIPLNNPTSPGSATDISTSLSSISTGGFDILVADSQLYVVWNGADGGGAIRHTYLDVNLNQATTYARAGFAANKISLAYDSSTTNIWVTFWTSTGNNGYASVVSKSLVSVLVPTAILAGVVINQLTSTAASGSGTAYYTITNNYSYQSTRSDYTAKKSTTQAGSVGSQTIVARSLGLASKAFTIGTTDYMLGAYQDNNGYQPSYFLISSAGAVIARLAYSNGGGYITTQVLPSVTVQGNVAQMAYLYKVMLTPVNKSQTATSSLSVYAQTGVNLASFDFSNEALSTAEIGGSLHIAGGFLWQYDGVKPVEHGFHVWPDDVKVTTSGAGGLITAQQYYYVATYEWTDGQGIIHRSAPSVPYAITTTGATSTNTINVPCLRLTYKVAPNKVRLCVYRWSTAQQVYYQVTSVASPTLNDTTADSVAITDTLADSAIIGNSILYTAGGVIENIAAPACSSLTLYKGRLFLVDAEDRNLLWFSKVVIEATGVEMSDLLTYYVQPTIGAQGSTGDITALSSMDDKLIPFKSSAIYYVVGNGPDNTGANNDYSEPTFIATALGCDKQQSIVLSDQGLIFDSDKGRWLLGRDLSTSYIGAPVEDSNGVDITSALSIPGTNQVRLALTTGLTLVYDYFYKQWGTFSLSPVVAGCLYQGLHTYLDSYGRIFQESAGSYVDGAVPVVMSFTTGWLNLAGLQGYQRAYFFQLLGDYLSPHKLNMQIAFNYGAPSQYVTIVPGLESPLYGEGNNYGQDTPYGGPGSLEQWQVFFEQQKITSFQISLTESYDASIGQAPGAGFTLSGLNLVVAAKKGYNPLPASRQAGS